MSVVFRLVALLIGYLLGSVSFGVIIGKIKGIDIRATGSKNPGATNASRTLGFGYGFLTLVLDCLKAIISALIVYLIFKERYLCVYAAFGAVVGHLYPIYFRFKGGKGVSTSLGLILVAEPMVALGCIIVFLCAVVISRYVSLGSVLCAFVMPMQFLILALIGKLNYPNEIAVEIVVIFFIDAIICFIKHKENVIRLKNGTESKFSFRKDK